jgi:hypothetical protein
VDFDLIDQLVTRYSVYVRYWEKSLSVLFMNFGKACDSIGRQMLYNILTEFGISMKEVRQIEMCLYEIYSTVHIAKNLSRFLFRMV